MDGRSTVLASSDRIWQLASVLVVHLTIDVNCEQPWLVNSHHSFTISIGKLSSSGPGKSLMSNLNLKKDQRSNYNSTKPLQPPQTFHYSQDGRSLCPKSQGPKVILRSNLNRSLTLKKIHIVYHFI